MFPCFYSEMRTGVQAVKPHSERERKEVKKTENVFGTQGGKT